MPVVAGLDLDDPVATGKAARQPNGVEGRFGTAVGEAPLRLLEAARQLLGDDGVVGHGLREMRAAGGTFVDRLDDQRVGMPDHHDAEAVVKVDILVAVDVPDPAAFAVIDEHRLGRRVLEGRRHAAPLHASPGAPEENVQARREAEAVTFARLHDPG